MNYVAHDCRNSRNPEFINTGKGKKQKNKIPNPDFCNNRWIDKDLTKARTQIPTWKYCRECCEKMGIDFENQKPSDFMSEEEKQMRKEKYKKSVQARELKIKSEILKTGQI